MVTYPKNHGGEYTVALPESIRLSAHQWEAGLAEIVFRQDWQAVIPNDIWVAFCLNDKVGGGFTRCKAAVLGEKEAASLLPTDTVKDIWPKALRSLFEEALKGAKLWVDARTEVSLEVNEKTERVKLTLRGVVNPDTLPTRLEMSSSLLQILGFTRNQLTEEGRYFLIKAAGDFESPVSGHPASFSRGISSLWIYCNIVRPHITGHTYAPLLRVIGVNREYGSGFRVEQFERIHYYSLLSDDISTISILITNNGGNESIKFSVPVVCKLHFRRKQGI